MIVHSYATGFRLCFQSPAVPSHVTLRFGVRERASYTPQIHGGGTALVRFNHTCHIFLLLFRETVKNLLKLEGFLELLSSELQPCSLDGISPTFKLIFDTLS